MGRGATTRLLDITSIFRNRGPERPRRTVAAIMFADIAGYSALMQADEVEALRARAAYRHVQDEAVTEAGGVVVQHYGDGSLSIFRSGPRAVEAARRMQRRLHSQLGIPVRIGIHVDDVVRDDEGVYGHGVNVAARVQSLCPPGAVLISDPAAKGLNGEIETTPMGTFQLKNIREPARLHALSDPGVEVPLPRDLRSTSAVMISPPKRRALAGRPYGPVARFLWEVRRRKVHKVATGYGLSALLLILLLELAVATAGLSSVVLEAAIAVLLAGFPGAVTLGWVFDLAPGWLVVTPSMKADE